VPVLYGVVFAVTVAAVGAAIGWLVGFVVSHTFQIRSFRRWLRRRLIHSYGCRQLSRRLGSSLLD